MDHPIDASEEVWRATKRPKPPLNPYYRRIRTVRTGIGPQLQSFNLPRRLFKWIYSVSLVILVTVMLLIISITPIDVVVQSSTASFSGVKLFIVIVVCVIFLIAGFVLYFLRLYQHRVSMNGIPSKSVYVPAKNDLPDQLYEHLEEHFQKCAEIVVQAGPLTNPNAPINHPGLSPPPYMARNAQLPPNLMYEDVVRSLGDKFTFHDAFVSSLVSLPKHYTFRQIVIAMLKNLVDKNHMSMQDTKDVYRFVELYEKFKFGKDLILEKEMVEFVVVCDRVGDKLFNYYGSFFALRKAKPNIEKDHHLLDSFDEAESYDYSYSDTTSEPESYMPRPHQPYSASYPSVSTDSIGSVIRKGYSGSSRSHLRRSTTHNSSGSAIRKRLSITGDFDRSRSTVMFDLESRPARERQRSSFGNHSGYLSEFDFDGDDSSVIEYHLNQQQQVPQFQYTISPPAVRSRLLSPTKLLELDISPKKFLDNTQN